MEIKKRTRIIFQVKPELRKALEDQAELDGRSLSNLVQKILEDWVKDKSEGKKEVRKKGA